MAILLIGPTGIRVQRRYLPGSPFLSVALVFSGWPPLWLSNDLKRLLFEKSWGLLY